MGSTDHPDGRIVVALELVNPEGEVVHTVKMSQTTRELSRRLEQIEGGLLARMDPELDLVIREVYA